MKLEARTKEFYRSALNTAPKIESLLQNQVYMFECILEILDRLDWRSPVTHPAPPEEEKEAEVLDRYHKSVESETVVKMDRSNKATATGESDFKKQAKKITERARQNIEEEPL